MKNDLQSNILSSRMNPIRVAIVGCGGLKVGFIAPQNIRSYPIQLLFNSNNDT